MVIEPDVIVLLQTQQPEFPGQLAVGQIAVHPLHLDAVLLLHLCGDHLLHIVKKGLIVHLFQHGGIAGVIVQNHVLNVGPGGALHLLVNELLHIALLRDAHILHIELHQLLVIRRVDIIPGGLGLAALGQGLVLLVQEGQAVEHIMLRIFQLLAHQLLPRRLLHHMLHKVVGVADGAGHHAGHGILVLADNSDDLYLEAVIEQGTQAQVFLGHVHIFFLVLVPLVFVGWIDVSEAHAADVLIAPALQLGVEVLLVHEGLHIVGQAAVGFQAQGVEHQVGDLVVLVHHQHHLVVLLRPLAVKHVVLAFQQGVDGLPVLTGQHLLPDVHHRVHLPEGGEIAAVVPAEGLAHGRLQQVHHVGLYNVVVHILGIEVHVQVIGILDGADMGRDLPGIVLQVFFKGLQVVFLGLGGNHGVHHVIHDGAGIDRVLVVLVFLRLGLNAHHAGHHAGHVQSLGLDGNGVAGKSILLNLVDVNLYAVGQGHDQRDADDADAAGKGRQDGAGLFGHQVVGGKGQGGEKAHGGLFPLSGRSTFGVAGDIGSAVVHNEAVLQLDDPAGVLHGQLRVVGHHDDQLVLGDFLQQVHNLHRGVRVQGAGGLIRHKDIRVVHQSPGDGHPLHLAAGHLVGLFVKLIPQAHLL